MRAGPTPLESAGHQHQVSQLLSLRRCKFTSRFRCFGSWSLACRDGEPLRRCIASRAATASPGHPVDSSDLARRLLHGRSAAPSDGFPLSENTAAPLPAAISSIEAAAPSDPAAGSIPSDQPTDEVPWREGVTDHLLVASTSNSEPAPLSRVIDSGATAARNRLHHHHGGSAVGPRQSAGSVPASAAAERPRRPGPETQGAEVSLSLRAPAAGSSMAADFTTDVFRWLDGSGGGLRQWLLSALQSHHSREGLNGGDSSMSISSSGGDTMEQPSAAAAAVETGGCGAVGGEKRLVQPGGGTQQATNKDPVGPGTAEEAVEVVDSGLEAGPNAVAAAAAAPADVGRSVGAAGGAVTGTWAGQERGRGRVGGLGGGVVAASDTAQVPAAEAATATVADGDAGALFALEPLSKLDADDEVRSGNGTCSDGGDGSGRLDGAGGGEAGRVRAAAPVRNASAATASGSHAEVAASAAAAAAVAAATATMLSGRQSSQGAAVASAVALDAAAGDTLWKGGNYWPVVLPPLQIGPVAEAAALKAPAGWVSRCNDVRLAPPPVRRTAASSSFTTIAAPATTGNSSSRRSNRSSSSGAGIGERNRALSSVEVQLGSEAGPGPASRPRSKPDALLTWELARASDWRRISVLVQLYGEQLNVVHVSSALVRLAKLHRRDAAALTLPADIAAAATDATDAAAARAASAAAKRVSRARAKARARAKVLSEAGGAGRWGRRAFAVERRRLRLCALRQHPGGVPNARRGGRGNAGAEEDQQQQEQLPQPSSVFAQPPTEPRVLHPDVARLLDSLLVRVPGLMPRAGHRTVSNMLWALGVLQPLTAPPPLLSRRLRGRRRHGGVPRAASTGALLAAKMRHFWMDVGPQSLALALWGLARMGLRPGPVWVAEFEYASARLLPRFSARELSCSLWALASLRLRPDALWLTSARRAMAAVLAADAAAADAGGSGGGGGVDLRALATMLWACAVLQVPLDSTAGASALAVLTARLRLEGGRAGAQALSMALWGCARLGLRPSVELLAAWRAAAAAPLLAAAPARAVACMLWSLARLRSAPPGAWVDAAAVALLGRAREGRLGRQALCLSVGALAQLDSRVSAGWLREFTAAAAPLVLDLSSSELGVVLHGLGRLVGGGVDGSVEAAVATVSRTAAAAAATAASRDDVAPEFLTAADAAAAAALPFASADDIAGIGGGLTALRLSRSGTLHDAFVRHVSALMRAGAMEPRHAAASLEYLAVSGRPTARCAFTAVATESLEPPPSESDDGGSRVVGAYGLCYDAVHALVPADTKQPLPPPQPPPLQPPAPSAPPPPRGFIMALLHVVLTAELDQHDVFLLGQALCASGELGCVAAAPAAVAAAVTRVCGHAPGARAVLRLLYGMYGLRVRPRAAWLARVAGQIGGRLRGLRCEELDLLLRLVAALQPPFPRGRGMSTMAAPVAMADATNCRWQSDDEEQQREAHHDLPCAVTALLTAAQPTLAAAPVQHLLQLAAALVAATTGPIVAAAAAATAAAPPLPVTAALPLPPGWMDALEAATAAKLSQTCVTAPDLVELLACFACLGHAPGAAWAAAWYDSTAKRLRGLSPAQLCMALHLQRRLGLRPPLTWLRNHAAALMAAAPPLLPSQIAEGEQQLRPRRLRHASLPPLEVLAAVAELQRLGLDDVMLAAADPKVAPALPPSAPLSSLAAAAATQLHREMRAAEPARQLAMLASLQAIADPQVVTPAPHAEGWAVGVLAMAHSVITERPLHELLAGLRPAVPSPLAMTAEPMTAADSDGDGSVAGASPEPLLLLLASMARWGHVPDHRWLSGIARHVCRQAESGTQGEGGGGRGGGWAAADAARAVCCLAALGYVPDAAVAERLQRLLQPALMPGREQLPPALAAELCCAWAAVRRTPPPAWWRAAEAGALAPAALAQIPPSALVRLPYSMVQLGHVPSYEWLARYLPHLPAALVAAAAAPKAAADVANLAWALGSAVHRGGYPPDVLSSSGALQALLVASGPLLGAMGPGQLVLLVEGLARGRHRLPQGWVAAFAGQVARQLPACGPSDLVSFLYCLAFLDAAPPAPWLAAALARTAQLLPPLLRSPEAYRADDLAWAVAKLDRHGAIVTPFLELLGRQRAAAAAATAAAAVAAAAPPPLPAWLRHAAAAAGRASEIGRVDLNSGDAAGGSAIRCGRRVKFPYTERRVMSSSAPTDEGEDSDRREEPGAGSTFKCVDDVSATAATAAEVESRGGRARARRGIGVGRGGSYGGARTFRLASFRNV